MRVPASLLLASLPLALLTLTACDGGTVAAVDDTDVADNDTPTSTEGCWEAATLLDVTSGPGAGASYAAPELAGWCEDDVFVVESNSIPHYTFVATTPNALVEADQHWEIPRNPVVAANPTEIPLLGQVGFAVNGLPFFGPNEAAQPASSAWGDPIYNGITDGCLGHTAFEYHYHALVQKCLVASGLTETPWTNADPAADEVSPVIGWALDGFPIYGPQGCADAACTSVVEYVSGYDQIADPTQDAWDAYAWSASVDTTRLDECNGHTGPEGDYHYHATEGFPYILGCYTGTPGTEVGLADDGGDAGGGGGQGGALPGCDEVPAGAPCCGDDICDGPETVDNCAVDCG